MRISMRRAGVACGALMASVALTLSAATSAWGSSTALVIGGIGTPSLSDVIMAQLLGGALKGQPRESVEWPAQAAPYTGSNDLTLGASINVGITNLNAQIDSALGRLSTDANGNLINGEKVTVVGLSAGSLVVNEVLRQMDASPDAPDKNEITFILVADSSRQALINSARYNARFDYTYQPAPETKYDIIVVTGEYDGFADFPDRWWNALAVANAIAGSVFVHVPVMFADLSKVPADNIDVDVNSKGGTTTHYLVPTEKLPLVQLFPSLASQEAELKAKIDQGYRRNDPPPASKLSTLVAAAPAAVDDTTDAEEPAATDAATGSDVPDTAEVAPAKADEPATVDEEDNAPAGDTVTDATAAADTDTPAVADADTDTEVDTNTETDDTSGSYPATARKPGQIGSPAGTPGGSDTSEPDDTELPDSAKAPAKAGT